MRPTGGTAPDEPSPSGAPSAFPWDDSLALGLGRLRWHPRDFWRATPRELMAAAGWGGAQRAVLDRTGLQGLLDRYPDPED